MKFTDSAVTTVLDIMKKRSLDPKKVFFEFRLLQNGAIGMGFSWDRLGKLFQFGELNVIIDPRINVDEMTVDYGEVSGRKGLIFLEGK
jgi:hypothetical protein